MLLDALADGRHHFQIDAEKIVAAHAGFARDARGDDDHVGAGDVGVGLCPLKFRVETVDGGRLRDVERFALGQAFDDVEEDDIAQFLETDEVGERAADLSATDECNLFASHFESFQVGVV